MTLLRKFISVSVLSRRPLSSSSIAAPLLLTPHQVHEIWKEKNVSLLDASWFMPNSPRNPYEEFLSRRIPGAHFLDLDEVSSRHELGLKHMMPEERVFADACERFGIEPSSHVVIYDTPGIFSSPRALFMFRSFGHQKSSVLNGGLPAWLSQGLPVESGPPVEKLKAHYPIPKLEVQSLRSYEQIVANSLLNSSTSPSAELVLDARSYGRYLGTETEPRPGLSSGRIPHSLSLPFSKFLQKQTGVDGTDYTMFLPAEGIYKALVEAVGVARAEMITREAMSVTTTCGSGMTAGVLWLGLKLLGAKEISLYDESWTGYAMRAGSKIERSL